MRRFFAGTAAALLAVVLFFPVRTMAVSAENAFAFDALSGRVLYEKNADKQSLIASTTKIMTALIICEHCNVLDRFRIPKDAIGIEGSSMYLQEGEILTVQELLYGLMLSSGNDAATALAMYCGGTVEGFVEQMNDKARQLGLSGTHFENPHGLDGPNHFSTARDLATLAAYAMKNPIFAQTVSTKMIKAGERFLRNHNKLLWLFNGADGVKTGYTKAAGRILVSSAVKNERRVIAVTINDPNDWEDHRELLSKGLDRYAEKKIFGKGQAVMSLSVIGGDRQQVTLVAAETFAYPVSTDEKYQLVLPGSGFVYAPITEGADAGYAYVTLNGNAVGKIRVTYGESVAEYTEPANSIWRKLFGGIAP